MPVVIYPDKAAFERPVLPKTCPSFDWVPTLWLAPLTAFKSPDRWLDAPSTQVLAKFLAVVSFL
jgi:hypothetical protein